jgi:TatD DNase family protein
LIWADSHAHPHFEPFCYDSIESLDIAYVMCVATAFDQFEQLLELKKKSSKVFISLGEHPLNELLEKIDIKFLEDKIKSIDAVGEIGFDSNGDFKAQRIAFDIQADCAAKNNLPIILHTRNAESETISAIKNFGKGGLKGVFHCFTGSLELAEFAIEMGWKISFSGIVTFKNAEDIRKIASFLFEHHKESILIETDAPYLAPVPFRGRANRVEYVKYVGEFLADFLKADRLDFAKLIKDNFLELFAKEII